jgi:hypothetical protein
MPESREMYMLHMKMLSFGSSVQQLAKKNLPRLATSAF